MPETYRDNSGLNLPYRSTVETLLETSLLPQDVPYQTPQGGGPQDIREIAHGVVMSAVSLTFRKFGYSPPPAPEEGWSASEDELDSVRNHLGPELYQVKKQVVIANNIARSHLLPFERPAGADDPSTPRARLQGKISSALELFTQRPKPANIPVTSPHLLDPLRGGMLIVAATGVGKTVSMAEYMRRAGVGKPLTPTDPELISALVIVPSRVLMRQALGQIGNKTLLRWLGVDESLVTAYWGDNKDTHGAVRLVTKQILRRARERGHIRMSDDPIKVVDEGHLLLEPGMLRQLSDLGTRAMVFTGTPDLDKKRDVRRYLPDFTAGSLRGSVEEGILSPVRLLTFYYGPEPGAAERLAVRLNALYLSRGRKTMTFCRPGYGSAQAQAIEKAINERGVAPFGSAGNFKSTTENDQVFEDFDKGHLRGITVTRMGGEGLDTPVDVGILIGPQFGRKSFRQKIGRIVRPGEDEAILIELLPSELPVGRPPMCSLWYEFGLAGGNIVQGLRIGKLALAKDEGEAAQGSRHRSQRDAVRTGHTGTIEDLGLPDDLLEALAPPLPARSIMVGPARRMRLETPPENALSAAAIAAEHKVPISWLHRQLDRQGIPYEGVWSNESEDELGFERWYDKPLTEEYLNKNPMPQLIEGTKMSREQIAEMFGVSLTKVNHIIDDKKVTAIPSLTDKNLRIALFDMSGVRVIGHEIDKIPVADETDVPIADITREFGEGLVYYYVRKNRTGLEVEEKRRHPSHGIAGYAMHASAASAEKIRAACNVGVATKEHIGYSEIAKLAGVSIGVALRGAERILEELPEAERPEGEMLRPRPGLGAREHLPRQFGIWLAEGLKPRRLPPHLVARRMVFTYFDAPQTTIIKRATTIAADRKEAAEVTEPDLVIINLGGKGGPEACYTWAVVEGLEKSGLPVRKSVARKGRINYEQVAHALEASVDKWNYSQEIQRRLGPGYDLVAQPTWEMVTIIMRELHCSLEALEILCVKAKASPADIRHVQSGDTILSPQLRLRLHHIAASIPRQPADFWIRHNAIAKSLEISGTELSRRIKANIRMNTSEVGVAWSPREGIIDLWYAPELGASIIRYVRSRRWDE